MRVAQVKPKSLDSHRTGLAMTKHLNPSEAQRTEVDLVTPTAVLQSREKAITSIIRGLKVGVGGVAAFALGWWESTSPIPGGSAILGLGLGGVALMMIGKAVTHFFRYGNRRVTVLLGATAGLGGSAVIVALSAARVGIPLFLEVAAALSVYGFATFIALVTIGALVRWLWSSDEDDGEQTTLFIRRLMRPWRQADDEDVNHPNQCERLSNPGLNLPRTSVAGAIV
jgi:hypothetical protein